MPRNVAESERGAELNPTDARAAPARSGHTTHHNIVYTPYRSPSMIAANTDRFSMQLARVFQAFRKGGIAGLLGTTWTVVDGSAGDNTQTTRTARRQKREAMSMSRALEGTE